MRSHSRCNLSAKWFYFPAGWRSSKAFRFMGILRVHLFRIQPVHSNVRSITATRQIRRNSIRMGLHSTLRNAREKCRRIERKVWRFYLWSLALSNKHGKCFAFTRNSTEKWTQTCEPNYALDLFISMWNGEKILRMAMWIHTTLAIPSSPIKWAQTIMNWTVWN